MKTRYATHREIVTEIHRRCCSGTASDNGVDVKHALAEMTLPWRVRDAVDAAREFVDYDAEDAVTNARILKLEAKIAKLRKG